MNNAIFPLVNWHAPLVLAIIAILLVGVAVGRWPIFRMNRATTVVVGATMLIWLEAISLPQALHAIDIQTLALLFGMMVINANLHLAGFFKLVAAKILRHARSPRHLLALTVLASGVLSALFLNDTVVLVLTPLLLEVTSAVGLNPIPFLIALATAANIGSAATVIGNPQNMLIGVASGIGFSEFARQLIPVALVGLVMVWVVVAWLYRRDLRLCPMPMIAAPVRCFQPLLRKGIAAILLVVGILIAGGPVVLAALSGASLVLFTRRVKPERVFRELDWSLLVFFAGLFVITRAIETFGPPELLPALADRLTHQGTLVLAIGSGILSNLISNVPAVLLLRPFISRLSEPESAWLTLAMATTLAGNLTLLGSVANLIVAESARRRGVILGFNTYLRAGLPITLLSLAWGIFWLSR